MLMRIKSFKILIVDDDELYRSQLKLILKDLAELTICQNQAEAFKALDSDHGFDLAIIDLNLPDELAGFKVLAKAKIKGLHTIVLSSEDSEQIFEDAYKIGCDHYLAKANFHLTLSEYVKSFIENDKGKLLQTFLETEYFTQDQIFIKKLEALTKINLKNIHLFLTGPTGSGKTYLAKFLHKLTHPPESPFIHINCSEISENLLESELFGHVKGAFTGAIDSKKGKLLMAHNGTLFLDEVTTMSLPMQQKLLKALEEKTFYPVGSNQSIQSHFSLISATCEDIFELIQKELFRKDLFFRINGQHLEIPPLQARTQDIELILKKWLKKSNRKFVIKESALKKLTSYSWPGNIRELKKVFTLLAHSENGIIEDKDLPVHIQENSSYFNKNDSFLTTAQKNFIRNHGLRKFIENLEKQVVKELYQENNGKVTQCIQQLKISNSAFYRILEKTLH